MEKHRRSNQHRRFKSFLFSPLWTRAVAGFAAIVIFSTTYWLMQPASALTKNAAVDVSGLSLEQSGEILVENEETPEDPTQSEQEEPAAITTAENADSVPGPGAGNDGSTPDGSVADSSSGWEQIPEAEQQVITEETTPVAGESAPSESQTTVAEDANAGKNTEAEVTETSGGTSTDTGAGADVAAESGAEDSVNEEGSVSETESPDTEELSAEEETTETEELSSEESEEEDEEEEEVFGSGKLLFRGNNYSVTIEYGEDAKIPEAAELRVRELEADSDEYQAHYETAKSNAEENGAEVRTARFFDITIVAPEKDSDSEDAAEESWREIEPAAPVKVNIVFDKEELELPENAEVEVLHFADENNAEAVEKEKVEVETSENSEGTAISGVGFDADAFSVFGVVGTETITTQVITAEGETYTIEVTYGPEANIPEDSELVVKEIIEEDAYEKYLSEAVTALSDEETQANISFARFFDIEIQKDGVKIEPAAPVEVKITNETALEIGDEESLSVVHFASKGTEVIDDITLSEDGTTTTHEQDSFSVTGAVVGSFSGDNWPDVSAGDYVLIVNQGDGGPYYAVGSSGNLTQVEYNAETRAVTFPNAADESDLSDYWWTYFVSGGNHRLTSTVNTNNKIYPSQTDGGSAIENTTNSPGANQGYIYRGRTYNRYCVAINNSGTELVSAHVTYNYGYTYPSNAAHFQFATNFIADPTGAYGTAASTVLTGHSKTLRIAEVETSDEELIDFEGFSWRSLNTGVATVSTDPDTDAPIATAVSVGTTRIIGTRTNEHGETDEVVWTVTVKDKTNNSIIFLHQPQDNANFANQDNIRPHDGYGNTDPTNYVKFVVALADEDGKIILYNGRPNVELPEGSVVPDRYDFELDSTGVFAIEEDTLSGISVPGYSYAGTYAYFGWSSNTDLNDMAVVDEFKNLGRVSSRYPNYYSVLGFKTSRGNPQYQDYAQTSFGEAGYGYYAYNPTGVLMIVLQPVSEDIAYRTSYHNDYVPGGTARTNIVDTTRARMIQGEWIPEQYIHDWYGYTIMTTKEASDLTPPADGYEFVGWFDSVDAEGNGTGNQIVGQTEEGYYYALKDGEKIIIRQNNDIYAKWELVRGTLRIRKVINGDLTAEELAALKVALSFTVTDDNDSSATITKSGRDMVWNGQTGTVDITGLSAATTYTVSEDQQSAALALDDYDLEVELTGCSNIKVSKTGAVTATVNNTYTKKVATIKVQKLESGTSSKKLPNASFDLYRAASDGDTETETLNVGGVEVDVVKVTTIQIGETGEKEVEGLPFDEYYMVETDPPTGYEALTSVIVFSLNSNRIVLHSQDHVSADGLTLSVYNDPGVALPSTGGPGTRLFTILGLAMMLGAGVVLFRRRGLI